HTTEQPRFLLPLDLLSLSTLRPPTPSTLFPYTTLFRSSDIPAHSQHQPATFLLPLELLRYCPETASLRHRNRWESCPSRLRRLRSEEHTSELQSLAYLVCRLLLEKKKHFMAV